MGDMMNMLKFCASLLSASVLAGSAMAADLPSRKVAPAYVAPVPVFTWTGFYVGANVGWAGSRFNNDYYTPGSPVAPFWLPGDAVAISAGGYNAFRKDGVTFGAQVGYNYQMGMFVAGLEADFNWLGLKRSSAALVPTPFAGVALVGSSAAVDWMLTLRPRLGLALGQFLPYVTGGLALVQNSFSQGVYFDPVPSAATPDIVSRSSTDLGWTVGGGLEYAFSPNWSAKVEYLHVFLPNRTIASAAVSPYGAAAGLIPYTRTISRSIDTVRVGVNYRFGGAPAPVVAKY